MVKFKMNLSSIKEQTHLKKFYLRVIAILTAILPTSGVVQACNVRANIIDGENQDGGIKPTLSTGVQYITDLDSGSLNKIRYEFR